MRRNNASYSGLEEAIASIAARFPQLRVLLLIRDPVERVWSHLSMGYRAGKFDPGMLEDEKAFRTFLHETEVINRMAYPTQIALRWKRAAPKIAFRHFFFDDLVREPAEVRRNIIADLGGDPDKPSGSRSPQQDRKAKDQKLELTDAVKAILVDHFRHELRACATMFGGPVAEWQHRYLEH